MPKQIRRILMLLIALTIAVSLPLTVLAESDPSSEPSESIMEPVESVSYENSMEIAILAVKNLFDIDDEVFTDFSYSVSYSNYEMREGLIWMFNWSSDDSYAFARVFEDGTVMSFRKYNYAGGYFGFANISRAEVMSIADAFMRSAKPDTYSYYEISDDFYVSIHSNEYRLNYYANINGYLFDAASVYIEIDKFTGEIVGYSTSVTDPRFFNFEDTTSLIEENAAVAAYIENIGLSLVYRSYFNYSDGTITVFPVYTFNSWGDRYISAINGDVVEYVFDLGTDAIGYDDNEASLMGASSADGAGGGASLSPAEIAAIDQNNSFISSDRALEILLEAMGLDDMDIDSFDERYISLNSDYINRNHYTYNISMYRFSLWNEPDAREDDILYFSGRVDAETGRVTQFSFEYYGMPQAEDGELTEDEADVIVEAFLESIAPNEYPATQRDELSWGIMSGYSNRGLSYYSYIRYENDIPFSDNGITVMFNMNTGRVTRYGLNWYDNVEFPDISNVISQQDALSAFVSEYGSVLKYVTVGEGNVALVYDFAGASYLDPFSGNVIGYDGEPVLVSSFAEPDYSDVIGHWSESVVNRLLDNGVYQWGGAFEPDRVMSEQEFLQYLLLVESYYYRQDMSAFFIQRGVDIDADPDRLLTRQEAVRIIVQYLGYGRLAEQHEWFVYPFADEVGDDYKGYVTICYMLGIVTGNNGMFDAAGQITRAQAAVILQNVILLKSA